MVPKFIEAINIPFQQELLSREADKSNCLRALVACALYDARGNFLTCKSNLNLVGECRNEQGRCGCVHAELRALGRMGGFPEYAVQTLGPCLPCAQGLVAAGVKEIYFFKEPRLEVWEPAKEWLDWMGALWVLIDPQEHTITATGRPQHRPNR